MGRPCQYDETFIFQNSKRMIAIPHYLWRRYADNEEISVWSDRWSWHPQTVLCFTPGGGEYSFGYFVPNLIMNEPSYSLKISFKPFMAWYWFIKKQWKVGVRPKCHKKLMIILSLKSNVLTRPNPGAAMTLGRNGKDYWC